MSEQRELLNELEDCIRRTNDKFATLMIIGHNPGIGDFVDQAAAQSDKAIEGYVEKNYEPATLSVIEVNIERWAEMTPDCCKMTNLLNPRGYHSVT